MKRVLLATILLALISSPIMAANIPRHVNPQQVEPELPLDVGLLTVYGAVIDGAVSGDFNGSLHRLKELGRVYVPDNVKYVYDRFNELLDREIRMLNETRALLDDAENELMLGLIADAERDLEGARERLAEIELIHSDLMDSSREFSRIIRVPLSGLQDQLDKLRSLIDRYWDRLRSLLSQVKKLREEMPVETRLVISVNSTRALVGSSIEVYGRLYDEYWRPLGWRRVTVRIDDLVAGEFTTDTYGYFKGLIRIPYIYRPEARVYAEYIPSGGDVGRFKASRSNIITIDLVYYTPLIHAYANATRLMPAQSIEVVGWVVVEGHPPPSLLHVKAFGRVATLKLPEGGFFKIELKVPGSASEGMHEIALYTEPEGVLAPSRKALSISVYRIPVYLEVERPLIALSGLQNMVRVILYAGEAREVLPMSGEISLTAFGSITSYRVNGSEFLINFTIPLSTSSGVAEVEVGFRPDSPAYRAASTRTSLLVMNPLLLLVPLPAAVYLAMLGMRRQALSGEAPASPAVWGGGVGRELPTPSPTPMEISMIYLEAARIVGEITGVERRVCDTIREYLYRVSDLLGDGVILFGELSYMAEAAIYGGFQPDLQLAKSLLEEMRRWSY